MPIATRTLTQLIEEIRERSDHENSEFVDDTDLATWINQSATALYDAVIEAAGPDAYVTSDDITTVAGTNLYNLPFDLYRLLGVDVAFETGVFQELRPYNFVERNMFRTRSGWTSPRDTRYALHGHLNTGSFAARIRFIPTPQVVRTVRIWYVPILPTITDAGTPQPLIVFNGWDEYVVADVCAKLLEKEESAAAPFITRRDEAFVRISKAAARLNVHGPREMHDASIDAWAESLEDDEPLGEG